MCDGRSVDLTQINRFYHRTYEPPVHLLTPRTSFRLSAKRIVDTACSEGGTSPVFLGVRIPMCLGTPKSILGRYNRWPREKDPRLLSYERRRRSWVRYVRVN